LALTYVDPTTLGGGGGGGGGFGGGGGGGGGGGFGQVVTIRVYEAESTSVCSNTSFND
jgi:hypothetical protein